MKKIWRSLLIFAICFGFLGAETSAEIVYQESWGAEEDSEELFRSPVALAKDSSGNIYMSDMGNHRIIKMDSYGNILATYGKLGDRPGEFNMPFGVAVDNELPIQETTGFKSLMHNSSLYKAGEQKVRKTINSVFQEK
jgi:tripartite motif-containing protein 71